MNPRLLHRTILVYTAHLSWSCYSRGLSGQCHLVHPRDIEHGPHRTLNTRERTPQADVIQMDGDVTVLCPRDPDGVPRAELCARDEPARLLAIYV